jgi:hypothetical protein
MIHGDHYPTVTTDSMDGRLFNNEKESSETDALAIAQQFLGSRIEEIRPFTRSVYAVSRLQGISFSHSRRKAPSLTIQPCMLQEL